jgi:hypothetical protein
MAAGGAGAVRIVNHGGACAAGEQTDDQSDGQEQCDFFHGGTSIVLIRYNYIKILLFDKMGSLKNLLK